MFGCTSFHLGQMPVIKFSVCLAKSIYMIIPESTFEGPFYTSCPRSSYLIIENAITMLITDLFYYMQARVYLHGQLSTALIQNS